MKKGKGLCRHWLVESTLTVSVLVVGSVWFWAQWSDRIGYVKTGAVIAVFTIGMVGLWGYRFQKKLCQPLKAIAQAIQNREHKGICSAWRVRSDEIGLLARAVSEQMETQDTYWETHCKQVIAQTEQRTRQSMAEEICCSTLPQRLPNLPSRAHFEVNGLTVRGTTENCQFYDYFYIDPGLLCIVIGETPGKDVAQAMYMVIAQTTIRSRLRQGRSLEETMGDVNAQLYDLGSPFCLNALVGTLNTADGKFIYVNAGQQRPLLMRNENWYEWLDTPVYAPLGMNEHVVYRAMELRLRQGDRIFLHTMGLDERCGCDQPAYAEQQMRIDLNLTRGDNTDGVQILNQIRQAAEHYCATSHLGYAMLTLLYCKGEKELAHCNVSAQPTYATEVAAFLKKQFEDNAIAPRYYAKQAVLVDEVFALCCRNAMQGSSIMVECGVAPDAQMVNIRMTAILGGINPLEQKKDSPAQSAVDFVQQNTDYITFQSGEEQDTITMVCFLEVNER